MVVMLYKLQKWRKRERARIRHKVDRPMMLLDDTILIGESTLDDIIVYHYICGG